LSDSSLPSPAAVSLLCLLRNTWSLSVPRPGSGARLTQENSLQPGNLTESYSSKRRARERGSFFFFFLFSSHCWASKMNLLPERSDDWQTMRKTRAAQAEVEEKRLLQCLIANC